MACCQHSEALLRAIATVRSNYPETVFPSDGTSQDAQSGTFARVLCDQIVRLAEEGFENDIEYGYCSMRDGLEKIDGIRSVLHAKLGELRRVVDEMRGEG